MDITPKLGLKKPAQEDFYNIDDFNYNADIIDANAATLDAALENRITNAGATPSIQSGLAAERPLAGTTGRLYIATDTRVIYRDNGTTWVKIGAIEWNNIDGKPSSFIPSAHKSTHATGGSDALSPADIGAVVLADFNAHINTSNIHRKITFGTAAPAGGADGDIYFQYE